MQKRERQSVLAALTMALPALPILILGLIAWHDPRDRYWASVYLVWGTVVAALGSTAAGWVTRCARSTDPCLTHKAFCLAGFVAWGLSFPVLLVINLTPLCLGQDNGDGRNNVNMCIFLAVVWFAYLSLPVAGGIAIVSKLASRIAKGRKDVPEVCQPQ